MDFVVLRPRYCKVRRLPWPGRRPGGRPRGHQERLSAISGLQSGMTILRPARPHFRPRPSRP